MNIGDRVRVKDFPQEVFSIDRSERGHFGRAHIIRGTMTGRMMPLTVWYSPDELEVVE